MSADQVTKACRYCARDLPLSAFYAAKGYRLGCRNECIECYAKHRRPQKYVPRIGWEGTERDRIRERLRHAVSAGKVAKPSACEGCGLELPREKLGGHHFDGYDDPFRVVWLCDPCHRAEHRRERRPA